MEDTHFDGKNNFKDNHIFYGQNSDGTYWLTDGTKEYIEREQKERDKYAEITDKINKAMARPKNELLDLPYIKKLLSDQKRGHIFPERRDRPGEGGKGNV